MCQTDRPVVVEVAQLVGQTLHVIRLQLSRVMDHVVVGRSHGSLTHRLGHDEEVIPSHNTHTGAARHTSELLTKKISVIKSL